MEPAFVTPAGNIDDIKALFDKTAKKATAARDAVETVIFGQRRVVDLALTALLGGGHALLIGLPGLGKTKLAESLSHVFGLKMNRIQCTPDLMPSDITGTEIMVQSGDGARSFKFVEGPVFCQYLMADEINRASPRTQSALLQAMQEGKVTVGGKEHALPHPFHVMATQNPIEQEGTYPLPEAQLDRFMLQIDVGYPDMKEERRMILETTGSTVKTAGTVFSAAELAEAQQLVRRMPVGEKVADAILNIVRAGRPEQTALTDIKKHVHWGPGPRAAQALMLAVRAKALLDGRPSPSLDDVADLAPAALKHRMALGFSARAEGITLDALIAAMVKAILKS